MPDKNSNTRRIRQRGSTCFICGNIFNPCTPGCYNWLRRNMKKKPSIPVNQNTIGN